jgi:Family of unknown function (DUF6311)
MTIRERYFDFLAVFAAGFIAFLVYADTAILHPFNIEWMLRGDPAWHLCGLLYFIRDSWTLPLGTLFSYGEGFSTSVVYTDSIPLLAIAIKLLATLTRSYPIFQPFGLWFLLCFILQAWFSFRLAKLFIGERSTCVLIGFLACFSPPFLVRGFGHEALMAHWLIIWALVLTLDEHGQQKALAVSWPLLLVVSLGVHAYIFFMCVALWAAANLRVLLVRPSPCRRVVLSAAGTTSSMLVFAYLYGYFMHVQKAQWGYAHYKLNFLAPLNPMGWSIVLPSFRDMTGGEYEGFNYFGLGILIILLVASFRGSSDSPFRLGDKILFMSLLVGSAIALTPRLHIGVLRRRVSFGLLIAGALVFAYGLLPLCSIPGTGALRRHMWRPIMSLTALLVGAGLAAVVLVPLIPEGAVGLVRASGRLFWPTWYFYFFLSCVLLARAMAWRRMCVLLVGCSLVQIIDLSPLVASLNRDHFSVGSLDDRVVFVSRHLTDTLKNALAGKRHLSILADGTMPPGWEQLTLLALQANAGIDKASYARVPVAYEAAAAARLREVDDGLFRDDTVYLAYPNYRDRVNRALAQSGSAVRRAEAHDYLVLWSER